MGAQFHPLSYTLYIGSYAKPGFRHAVGEATKTLLPTVLLPYEEGDAAPWRMGLLLIEENFQPNGKCVSLLQKNHHRTIQESTLSLGEEVTLPWRGLFSPIESGGQGGRRLGAERRGRRCSALHRPTQRAAPAIAARCIKHRSALPFRGLHHSPLTASHRRPSVMPQQTKKLRDERHRTAFSRFLFTLSIPPGGHSLQLPYRSCSRRS